MTSTSTVPAQGVQQFDQRLIGLWDGGERSARLQVSSGRADNGSKKTLTPLQRVVGPLIGTG